MKNLWLEKGDNRYSVALAGLDLEQLINKMAALDQVLIDISNYCNSIDRTIENLPDEPNPSNDNRASNKGQISNIAKHIRNRTADLRILFKEVGEKLVEKRGKWAR